MMAEMRRDPVLDRWVILAPERAVRPSDPPPASCPFCPGNEDRTPPERLADRRAGAPDSPGWITRVVPNRYPALREDAPERSGSDGLFAWRSAAGAHEVIVETPEHGPGLADLPASHVERVLRAYRDRAAALGRDPRVRYVLLFKNHGAASGATMAHAHAQVAALPVVPETARRELEGSLARFRETGRCVFCDVLGREIRDGSRVVLADERFAAVAPYASRFPYEVQLLPRAHASAFERLADADLAPLARALRHVLGRLRDAAQDPPYNLLIHTAPCREPELPHYHWHVEIVPRTARTSGFEWGTGLYILTTPPEEAAEKLRAAEEPAPRRAPTPGREAG